MFMAPEEVPVERLLNVAETILAKNRNSADAHYTLARIHYLAFVRQTRTVPAYMPSPRTPDFGIPSEYQTGHWLEYLIGQRAHDMAVAQLGEYSITRDWQWREAFEKARVRHVEKLSKEKWRPDPEIDPAQCVRHAEASLAKFREAIRLKPAENLYVLGLASLMEQIVDWKRRDKPVSTLLPPEIAKLDYSTAKSNYLKAFRATADKDASAKELGIFGLVGMISHEAGVGFLRLSDRESATDRFFDFLSRRKIQSHLDAVRQFPQGVITPMILALHEARGIDDLIASELRVDFDVRGYGPAERWPWVRPTTGLLVWDPMRRGEITSGRQLFGGYTFQIFLASGYDALAALDDDGDGVLRGAELAGIRVWFDRDGDGRSTFDEVIDLATLGIVGIAVCMTGAEGIHPTNPAGVIFSDGRTLPTWDWMVAPHRN